MATIIEERTTSDEERVLRSLRERGGSSVDELAWSVGLDWVPVLSIIDRLARAGSIVLTRHGADYHVSLGSNA